MAGTKPRLEWDAHTAFLRQPSRYVRGNGGVFFARIMAIDRLGSAYYVMTNDFDTTGKTFPDYEAARNYILALYALIY
jgi:hypothetical protein